MAHDGNFGHTVTTAQLQVQAGNANSVSILDELHRALTGQPVPVANVKVADLLIHSVVGHRLWAHALDRKERFIVIDAVQMLQDAAAKQVWATITVPTDLLQRRDWSAVNVLNLGHLAPDFRIVQSNAGTRVFFEQVATVSDTDRAADNVMDVVGATRSHLWQTVTSSPPYRRYYLYLSQANESRLPQIVAAYLLLFWLGSLTRYRPVELLVARQRLARGVLSRVPRYATAAALVHACIGVPSAGGLAGGCRLTNSRNGSSLRDAGTASRS